MSTGIIVFAHGSRLEPANEAVRMVAAGLAQRVTPTPVATAFLWMATPHWQPSFGTGFSPNWRVSYFNVVAFALP